MKWLWKFFSIILIASTWLVCPLSGIRAVTGSRSPEPTAFTQLNLDSDPNPDASQWIARSGREVFRITVYDGGNDMPVASNWEAATDFQNDTWLFDYRADDSIELIVKFQSASDHAASAWVWDDQDISGAVEYSLVGANIRIVESPFPTLVVEAAKDWVKPDGHLTTNLFFYYDGSATNFGFKPDGELRKYFQVDGAPDFRVSIVDEDGDGIIDYEHSQVLASVPLTFCINRNGMKVNPSQNPPKYTLSSLYWPLLSLGDDLPVFNYFDTEPIIEVDWGNSKIKDFGILGYPVENGYHINNLDPWVDHQLNPVDFENAMAYYDLAANRDGLPELHVRHVYWPVDDLSWRTNPSLSVNEVVYSWRINSSDRLEWDYKLSLAGANPITTQVRLADFDLQILPYETLPTWVLGQNWVNQSFVVPETRNYVSSEGIYEWSTTEGVIVDITQSDQAIAGSLHAQRLCLSGAAPCDLSRFYTLIAPGLRGEYRFSDPTPVNLYLSPLDGRLHLTGAQAGVLNLGSGNLLRFHNLDGDDFLDGWTLERQSSEPGQAGEILEGLFKFGDRYLLFDHEQVQLFTSLAPDSLFTIIPPTEPANWQDFQQRLSAASPKDPYRLSTWLDGLEAGLLHVALAHVSLPGFQDGSYIFELTLDPGFRVTGRDDLSLLGRSPGRYRVTYAGGLFSLLPLTSPRLALGLAVRPSDPLATAPLYRLDLTAHNLGAQDSPQLNLLVLADCGLVPIELLRTSVYVPGRGRISWPLLWQPLDRPCRLTAALTGSAGQVAARTAIDLPALLLPAATAPQVLQASSRSFHTLIAFSLLILLAALTGWSYWLHGSAYEGEDG
jgi:hypothetical protein